MKYLFSKVIDKFAQAYWKQRMEHLKSQFANCGQRVTIEHDVVINSAGGLSVGDDVKINSMTHIFASGGVTIGDRSQISALCSITSVTHEEAPERRNQLRFAPVLIGEDVWLGTGVIVLPGVQIGNGSIVGAGAVVTKDIPSLTVVAGIPARVMRALS